MPFTQFTSLDFDQIKAQIRDTIRNFEPRVDNLVIEPSARPDDNTFSIKLIFDIVGINVPTQTFTFLLEPTR